MTLKYRGDKMRYLGIRRWTWGLAIIGLFLGGRAAVAEPPDEHGVSPWLSEVRAGLSYHEDSRLKRVAAGSTKNRESGVIDFRFEALTAKLPWTFENPMIDFVLRPRLNAGFSINAGGGTSYGAAGFTWSSYIFKKLFIEGSFGGAVHNGGTDGDPKAGKRNLGTNPVFWQALSLGLDLYGKWRLIATVDHLDNFHLGDHNAGLTNIGLKVGYRF